MARACMKNIPIVLMLTLISCREACPAGRKKIRGGYAYAGSTAQKRKKNKQSISGREGAVSGTGIRAYPHPPAD